MLNGKKRAYLRSLANTIKPTSQIGKEGITREFLDQLEDQLRARELVKVNILETAALDAKEAANAICEEIRAEYVQAIGSKFTIYKRNTEASKIQFPWCMPAKSKAKSSPLKGVSKRQVRVSIRNKGKSKKK